jgi:hypothetical protein
MIETLSRVELQTRIVNLRFRQWVKAIARQSPVPRFLHAVNLEGTMRESHIKGNVRC